jgi:hypothetical protein
MWHVLGSVLRAVQSLFTAKCGRSLSEGTVIAFFIQLSVMGLYPNCMSHRLYFADRQETYTAYLHGPDEIEEDDFDVLWDLLNLDDQQLREDTVTKPFQGSERLRKMREAIVKSNRSLCQGVEKPQSA